MANTKISDLTASASNLASTDLAPVVQTAGVGPVKMTGLQLAGGLLGSTTFNGATSVGTALSTVAITGTGGQFSCAAATLAVGQNVTISGTLGGTGSITGYSSPTTYTISATNGSTTFTLVNASTGAALTTTAGTPTGLTYVVTSPVVNFTQTWNNSNVTFTGLKFNATDTASASGSLLLDLQVGGVSRLNLNKAGTLSLPMLTIAKSGEINVFTSTTTDVATTHSLFTFSGPAFSSGTINYLIDNIGQFITDYSSLRLGAGGTSRVSISSSGVGIRADNAYSFSSDNNPAGTPDLILRRATTATLQLGAADAAAPVAQTFKVQSGTAGASATTVSISGTSLTIAGTVTGTIAIGHAVTGTGVSAGTLITAGSGTSWTVNNSQTVGPITAYFNSVGADFTIRGSQGSGPSAGGSIIFQVAPAGSAATTAQNAYQTVLQITGAGGLTGQDGATANTLALRNGTSAQTFRVYGTTSGGNASFLSFYADPTGYTSIYNDTTGSGTFGSMFIVANAIRFQTGTSYAGRTARWQINDSGHFIAETDNTYDIGAATTTRPRNVFIAGYEQMTEMTAPAAPAANSVRIYAEDNGSGKTRLMALFATGAAQQIAIEP